MRISINHREYLVHYFDEGKTHGVLRGLCGQPILCGFSVDDRDGVHVIGFRGGEWRATSLEEALTLALAEMEKNNASVLL